MPNDNSREGDDEETLLAQRLEFLKSAKDHQYEILKQLFAADAETLYQADFVAFGVMQRSMALIDGFALLVEHKNALAAAPLLRLQIDSVIRFNACWLVDDAAEITTALFDDRLNRIKDRTGKVMTDRYLVSAISDRYPWLPDAYKQASSFIHLSVRQLIAPIVSTDSETQQIRMVLGSGGREWTAAERLEAVEIFIQVTDALFQLMFEWIENRRMFRDRRAVTSPEVPG